MIATLLLAVKPKQLVFLDESWCTTAMAREYGWAPIGERAVGLRPGRSWRALTLIGAIRLGKKPKLMTHTGAVNGRVFLRYVRTRLGPWLRRGDVVVMDNLGAHKVRGVREAIAAVGACVVYLPPYSPDMNPIELWWPDLKRQVRTAAPRTEAGLAATVRRVRAGADISKIAGWFRHCLRFNQVN
jgi:transposase